MSPAFLAWVRGAARGTAHRATGETHRGEASCASLHRQGGACEAGCCPAWEFRKGSPPFVGILQGAGLLVEGQVHHLELAQEVSFFNKASVLTALDTIPENSKVIIDCTHTKSMAYDVVEILQNYKINAKAKNIIVETINFIEPK